MKTEKIVQARLNQLGWTEADLRERGKGASEKVDIAEQIRAETTLSLKRVAAR